MYHIYIPTVEHLYFILCIRIKPHDKLKIFINIINFKKGYITTKGYQNLMVEFTVSTNLKNIEIYRHECGYSDT